MGLFTKKEKTHFERDEEGRVVEVLHDGVKESTSGYESVREHDGSIRTVQVYRDPEYRKAKSVRQLEQEFPEKFHPKKSHPTWKKIGRGFAALDKKIVAYNRRSNMMNPYATQRKRSPPMYGFGNMPTITYGLGSFGTPRSSTKKPSTKSTKYTIVNNKAYPIVTSSSKKKKKSSKKSSSSYSLTDNWGLL